jgi:protein dithiol oxidoreductase (disulfide-forming)
MQLIKKILLVLAVCGFTGAVAAPAAPAKPATPREGADYVKLSTPQPVAEGKKIEVVEFFSYACPHCKAFDPALEAWVKTNADKVTFRRVHVAFRQPEQPLQRLYLTLEAMKMTEQLHHKIFAAVHEEQERLYTDEAVVDWAVKNGIDREKFLASYNSFDMQARLTRNQATVAGYQIDHWPAVGIAGRYLTSPSKFASAAGVNMTTEAQHAGGLAVMDFLVAKALTPVKQVKPATTKKK